MVIAGEALAGARQGLTVALGTVASEAYAGLAVEATARGRDEISLRYGCSWAGSLAEALIAARDEDFRRGVTTVGPHRDELELAVGGLPARTHASQGEQRSLALALRLAGHRIVTDRIGSPPVLLLDDVFSELDSARAGALLEGLPRGQALLTTASGLPPGTVPSLTARVVDGKLVA